MDFSVEQITPVSTAQEGRNYFRVEARLHRPSERVRPGMEGVGKIIAGERTLIWIWTHHLGRLAALVDMEVATLIARLDERAAAQ